MVNSSDEFENGCIPIHCGAQVIIIIIIMIIIIIIIRFVKRISFRGADDLTCLNVLVLFVSDSRTNGVLSGAITNKCCKHLENLHLEVMAHFFEVDSTILVEVGRGQSALDAGDLVALDVEFAHQVVVTLSSESTTTHYNKLLNPLYPDPLLILFSND